MINFGQSFAKSQWSVLTVRVRVRLVTIRVRLVIVWIRLITVRVLLVWRLEVRRLIVVRVAGRTEIIWCRGSDRCDRRLDGDRCRSDQRHGSRFDYGLWDGRRGTVDRLACHFGSKSVDGVRLVFDRPQVTVRIYGAVKTVDIVTVPRLLLILLIAGDGFVHRVIERVMRRWGSSFGVVGQTSRYYYAQQNDDGLETITVIL